MKTIEFIKTKKGWFDEETNSFYPYGTIALKTYNSNRKNLKNIMLKLEKYYSVSKDLIFSKTLIESLKRNLSDDDFKFFTAPHSNGPYFVIGKNDDLRDFEREIFEKDQDIIAIMLYQINRPFTHFCVAPDNAIPFTEDSVYLPLYSDDAHKIFSKSSEIETLQSYRKISNSNALMDKILKDMSQGYEISFVGANFYTSLIAAGYSQNFYVPLQSSIAWFNNHYCDKFIVTTIDEFYSLCARDTLELLNLEYSLIDCPICHEIFAKRDKRINFCPKCSADKKAQKKYNDQKRKRNITQIEHKAIVDMLRNRNEDYNDFVNESYYYRDLIKGKEVPPCPVSYDSSIQTRKQYEEWLKKKHNELTKRPKKRPAH